MKTNGDGHVWVDASVPSGGGKAHSQYMTAPLSRSLGSGEQIPSHAGGQPIGQFVRLGG
jgi:hypothetical protein